MSVYFTSDLHFGHELVLKKYPSFRKRRKRGGDGLKSHHCLKCV
ncbi:MAG: hypothetical protein ACFNTA_10145 [Campylobacter sp.]